MPIFCKECSNTTEEDYTEALSNLCSGESDRFPVGMCCVFAGTESELEPVSRKEYKAANELSYSGACQFQPCKAVFMHNMKNKISQVKCYMHVHSRNSDETFLYCCIKCESNKYTRQILNTVEATASMSTGYSLGTGKVLSEGSVAWLLYS